MKRYFLFRVAEGLSGPPGVVFALSRPAPRAAGQRSATPRWRSVTACGIRSKVMGVDPVKQTLKVAEKEVRLLDTTIGRTHAQDPPAGRGGQTGGVHVVQDGDVVLVLGYAARTAMCTP